MIYKRKKSWHMDVTVYRPYAEFRIIPSKVYNRRGRPLRKPKRDYINSA